MLVDIVAYQCRTHEFVLSRFVRHFVEHPVRVKVPYVASVPVVVVAVGVLVVVAQPFLVVGCCQRHQVLRRIGAVVGQGGTVLYVLAGVGHFEVEVYLFVYRGVGTQVQSVAAHLRIGKNVLVAHIRVSGADTRIVFHRADNDCIRRSHTGSEETVDIIGNDYIRAGHSVEISQIQPRVYFRPPVLVGRILVVRTVDASAGSLTIYILYIVPLRQLLLESGGAVQLYREFLLGTRLLRSDKNHTVRCAATIQCRSCRPFQHGHAFNIVRIDA